MEERKTKIVSSLKLSYLNQIKFLLFAFLLLPFSTPITQQGCNAYFDIGGNPSCGHCFYSPSSPSTDQTLVIEVWTLLETSTGSPLGTFEGEYIKVCPQPIQLLHCV